MSASSSFQQYPLSPQSPSSPIPQPRPQISSAQRTAEAKAAFTAALHSVGSNLDSDLQARASNIHANAKALSKQEGVVQKNTKKLKKENEELEKFMGKQGGKLREFDDLEGLLGEMEAELGMLEETLERAERSEGSSYEEEETEDKGNEEGVGGRREEHEHDKVEAVKQTGELNRGNSKKTLL